LRESDCEAANKPGKFHLPGLQRAPGNQLAIGAAYPGGAGSGASVICAQVYLRGSAIAAISTQPLARGGGSCTFALSSAFCFSFDLSFHRTPNRHWRIAPAAGLGIQ